MHGSDLCIGSQREGKNGNPDETELRGRTEEGKKMAHPAKR